MRIKQLHLRNIASLERADIDFEHDLCDAATGQPAPVFLISGDTGAGKTALLDAISLALYKTTSRVDSVENSVNNRYRDAEGREMQVNSISQYTRIGCGEKSECYTEVVFEGNDGAEYTARLELGFGRASVDPATGVRTPRYRTPRWSVRREGDDWLTTDVRAVIQQAVGLSFKQFGRMAMLAQGQFATFLTGSRKEREAILEQLTNTEHFTLYGRAVTSLCAARRAARDAVQARYDTERGHTLEPDELQRLQDARAALDAEAAALRGRADACARSLALVDAIAARDASLAALRERRAAIEREMAGEDYRRDSALVADWDATVAERRLLAEAAAAREARAKAAAGLDALGDSYGGLSAGLELQRRGEASLRMSLREADAWLAAREAHDALFGRAGEVVQQLRQLVQQRRAATDNAAALGRADSLAAPLAEALEQRRAEAAEAERRDKEAAEAIDRLIAARDALRPAEVNTRIAAAEARRAALDTLRRDLLAAAAARCALDEALKDAAARTAAQQVLDDAAAEAERRLAAARSRRQECADRLLTMQMSAAEAIARLRERLRRGHGDTCPLCGSHIAELPADESFAAMLTPLEEEAAAARLAETEADAAARAARSAAAEACGRLDAARRHNTEAAAALERGEADIRHRADALQLPPDAMTDEALAAHVAALDADTRTLRDTQQQAERLQAEIGRGTALRRPLEQQRLRAERLHADAATALAANAAERERLRREGLAMAETLSAAEHALATHLSAYSPDWSADPAATAAQLAADAAAYTERKAARTADALRLDNAVRQIQAIDTTRSAVLELRPDWAAALPATSVAEPAATDPGRAQPLWAGLLARLTALSDAIAAADATAARCDAALAASAVDAARLAAIEAATPAIDALRRRLQTMAAELRSRLDAIAAAEADRRLDAGRLEAMWPDGVPAPAELQQTRAELEARLQAIAEETGAIAARLDADRRNVQALQALRAELDAATAQASRWERLNAIFGGTRFRTLVQTHILRPLLNNANLYLRRITDRYTLTCSRDNEQLAILVHDRYNKDQVRSATVLSGGERFMVSLALSLALSSLNRSDMNVNILFIDEGFGTLDERSLDSVMQTLERLGEMAGAGRRRVGIISHRDELADRIPVKIRVERHGEGRSRIAIDN